MSKQDRKRTSADAAVMVIGMPDVGQLHGQSLEPFILESSSTRVSGGCIVASQLPYVRPRVALIPLILQGI